MPDSAAFTAEKWVSMGQAPALFWIVVGAVLAGLAIFALWTYFSGNVPRSITPGTLGSFVGLLIVWTFFLYLVPSMTATQLEPTERTWDWASAETLMDPGGSGMSGEPHRGYQVYVANSCAACHTLYLRPQDIGTGWSEGTAVGDVARASDYTLMPEPPLGTQRNGPDLSFIGRRISDMGYQIDHLVSPRKYKPDSIMPSYRHLSERDLRDLAAFLVTLGNSKRDLIEMAESGLGSIGNVADIDPVVQQGMDLYRSMGCVGCHSVDGRPNVGPTWLGLWGKEEEIEGGGAVTVDAEYLEESIRNPNAKIVKGYPAAMPPYLNLTDDEVDALIAFIETLAES